MVARRLVGMSRQQPYTTKSFSTLRLSFTLQNGLRWSDRDDFWLGNPLTMTSLRFWYTEHVFEVPSNASSPVPLDSNWTTLAVLWITFGL